MTLLSQDRPYLEWRAEEAGTSVDALRPHSDMLVPELDGFGRNPEGPELPPRPKSRLDLPGHGNPYPLSDSRIAFVGAGPGTIMLASYLAGRGARAENMTVFDPSGSFGGKWQNPDVRAGGFNNPMSLWFRGAAHNLQLHDRSGYLMLEYLRGIADDYLAGSCELVADSVSAVSAQRSEDAWLLEASEGGTTEADIVVLASGTPHPNRIDGGRFKSNLDQFPAYSEDGSFVVERNQRELTIEELRSSAEGKPIIIVGVGNSMAAMIHQIQRFEDRTGTQLNYRIITDRSELAVEDPYYGHDGKKSIFRNPREGYLTGYSADIARDRNSYYRALKEGRIIPAARSMNYSERRGKLVVKTADGKKYRFEDPQVFALIGHSPDLTLFRQMGALGLDHSRHDGFTATRRLVRPADGAVFSRERGGYMSNVFAIGSVAATASGRHLLVIPGINGQVPATTLTMGVRSIAERSRADAKIALQWDLGRKALDGLPDLEFPLKNPLLPSLNREIIHKINRPGGKFNLNEEPQL